MTTTYVKCQHTQGTRAQECVLVLVDDRMACVPIAPARNAVGEIALGVAMTAVGVISVRDSTVELHGIETPADLDALVARSGGFLVGPDWTYRTRLPIIGTMILRGNENITATHVPAVMLARLTPNRAPLSTKPVKVVCGIGAGILAIAGITYLATDSLELLFGIGFWGVLMIGTALFLWLRYRNTTFGLTP